MEPSHGSAAITRPSEERFFPGSGAFGRLPSAGADSAGDAVCGSFSGFRGGRGIGGGHD